MLVHRTWNIIRNMRKAIMITALLAASLSCFAAGTITVSGSAEVSAVPDMASFTLTASFTEQTTKEAMDKTSAMINEAIAILESEYGLADDDITTSYIGVSPEYIYKDGERVHTGQSASQSLEITIRNMDSIGPIYGRLSELDGITLSSISLSSTKMAEALKAARIGAVNDARDKAETYAEAAGAVLGSVERISDSSPSYAPLFRLEAASMDMAGNSGVTYRAGDVTARAEVSITYTLN